MSSVLIWMGGALIGVFVITVVGGMLPLRLLLPTWQLKISSLIIASAPYAGIGTIMILMAQKIDDESKELKKWVRRLRFLAIPAAIGFLLLLPLQTHASYKLLKSTSGEELQAISQLQEVLLAIQSAKSNEDLLAALSKLPGAPESLNKLTIPLPQAKKIISERLSGEINKLDNQSDNLNASRWQQGLVSWARNCLLSLCYSTGFSEIAKFPKSKNSLLFSIFMRLGWNRRKRWVR